MDDHATHINGTSREQRALAVLRIALGAMFIWVFFENLGKGAYSPSGYKGVIDYYLKNGHSPAAWKAIMSVMAANARVVAPVQAMTELGFGVLLLAGAATRVIAAGRVNDLRRAVDRKAHALGRGADRFRGTVRWFRRLG